nr:MAG TPA: hypothetical protein [Caudoviricetes sp.]
MLQERILKGPIQMTLVCLQSERLIAVDSL